MYKLVCTYILSENINDVRKIVICNICMQLLNFFNVYNDYFIISIKKCNIRCFCDINIDNNTSCILSACIIV